MITCVETLACAFALSASSQSFSSGGGGGAFNVNAGLGCDWTAASDADWLTVLPGVRGNGNGTVAYAVESNIGTASRAARITITGKSAGANFTVTQIGLSAPATELKIDDGSIERSLGFDQNGGTAYFVNRITPSSYPATLSAVAIFFPSGVSSGFPFQMVVGSAPVSSTNINGVALQRIPIEVNAPGQFNVYTIPGITITSGDFVIGLRISVVDYYPIARDTTPPLQKRSYFSFDGESFGLIDDEGLAGNFMFRARLTPTPTSCPLPMTISPSIAAPEVSVALNGANFTGVTDIRFANDLPAGFSVNSASQLTAIVPSGALSGGLTIGKNGCPDTRTGFFNVNQATATELSVDDGASEINIGFGNGGTGYSVNRLTPLSYPATLTGASIYFSGPPGLPAGAPVTVLVGTNPSGSANINGVNFQQTSQQLIIRAASRRNQSSRLTETTWRRVRGRRRRCHCQPRCWARR